MSKIACLAAPLVLVALLTQDASSTMETGEEALLIVDSANTNLTATTGLERA